MTDQELVELIQSMAYQRDANSAYSNPLPQETSPYTRPNQMNPAFEQYMAQNFQGGQQTPNYLPIGNISELDKLNLFNMSANAGGAGFNSGNTKGMAYGGRLSADLPLSEQQLLNLGISGTANDVTYGMGTPYQGRSARSDITGIDATLRDLARNQEFGASYAKDPIKNDPFYSLFYRKRF
jgi:hypothetical protein